MNNKKLYPSGPYTTQLNKDGCDEVWDIYAASGERPLVSVPFWTGPDDWCSRAKATAHLFAAAPDLVEALQFADGWLSSKLEAEYEGTAICLEIRSALARVFAREADAENVSDV